MAPQTYRLLNFCHYSIVNEIEALPQPFFAGHAEIVDPRYQGKPNAPLPDHMVLFATLSGRARFVDDNGRHDLEPGAVVLKTWEDVDSVFDYHVPMDRKPWEFVNLIFNGAAGVAQAMGIIERYGRVTKIGVEHPCIERLQQLTAGPLRMVELDAVDGASLVTDFLYAILAAAEVRDIERRQNMVIRHVARQIRQSNGIIVGVDQLATRFGLSREHLTREFRRAYGKGPGAYAEQIRIREAQRLLRETQLKSKTIAAKLGYTVETTFYRAFKRLTGMTPEEYRRSNSLPIF